MNEDVLFLEWLVQQSIRLVPLKLQRKSLFHFSCCIKQIDLHQPGTLITAGSYLTLWQQTSNWPRQVCRAARREHYWPFLPPRAFALAVCVLFSRADSSNKRLAARQPSHITSGGESERHRPTRKRRRDRAREREGGGRRLCLHDYISQQPKLHRSH